MAKSGPSAYLSDMTLFAPCLVNENRKNLFLNLSQERGSLVILSPPRRKNSYGSSDSPVEGGRGTRYDDLLREAPHKRGTFQTSGAPCQGSGFKRTDPSYPATCQWSALQEKITFYFRKVCERCTMFKWQVNQDMHIKDSEIP